MDLRDIEKIGIRNKNRLGDAVDDNDYEMAGQYVKAGAQIKSSENALRTGYTIEMNAPVCFHENSNKPSKTVRFQDDDDGRCRYIGCAFKGRSEQERDDHEDRRHI